MPQPYWREMDRFRNRYPLKEAAANNQLIVVRCNHCHRGATYLATDLAAILGPERDARLPPFACSKCGMLEYVSVKLRVPEDGDYGNLPVRRPGPVRKTQTWVTVRLGD